MIDSRILGERLRQIRTLLGITQKQLAASTGMTQSAISHQLRVLKQARLVTTRREGKTIFYSLCDEHVQRIFYCALDHVME